MGWALWALEIFVIQCAIAHKVAKKPAKKQQFSALSFLLHDGFTVQLYDLSCSDFLKRKAHSSFEQRIATASLGHSHKQRISRGGIWIYGRSICSWLVVIEKEQITNAMRFGARAATGKHRTTKLVFVCAGLLGAALVADLRWASSSSTAAFSNWAVSHTNSVIFPNQTHISQGEAKKSKKDVTSERKFSATFADLPAPELKWEKMPPALVPRLDGAAIQIKDLLYVFAGYGTIDFVHSHVDIYNFTDNRWGGRFDMPKEMAHSHLGMVTDGRYIYVVTGQYGPQCRGPTAHTFVLDTVTKQWRDMPPLPVPRYAPATTLWRGRLHVMGGSKENRHTPALEHWSIAVKEEKVLETEWRSEIPIPRGGPHRACVVFEDRLYVFGGQEGDFMAKPGSPIFKCSRRNEVVFDDVYMLDDDMKWKTLPPMPKPDSHIEFAWAIVNNSIFIVGGTTEKHPETKKMILVGEIFEFQFNTQKWKVVGKLPFRVKTTLVGFWDGWLYFTSGQRDRGPDDPAPKKVIGEMWRTKLKL